MPLQVVDPLFDSRQYKMRWGADPTTGAGAGSPSGNANKWLGCVMPMARLYIPPGGSHELILNGGDIVVRHGGGADVADVAKIMVLKSTDGDVWTKEFEIDVTSQVNALSSGSYQVLTPDVSAVAEAARTVTVSAGEQVAWAYMTYNDTGAGLFLRRANDTDGIQDAFWTDNIIDSTDALDTITKSTQSVSGHTGDIHGNLEFLTREKTWMEYDSYGTHSVSRKLRIPWCPDLGYSVMLRRVRTPDTITTTFDLEHVSGAAAKLCDMDVVMSGSGTDKVTFGSTPADVLFNTTSWGRPIDDPIDFVLNLWDESGVKAECGWINRKRSEDGLHTQDLTPRAHASSAASTHLSSVSLSAFPGMLYVPGATGASTDRIVVGIPLYVIGDSQSSRWDGNSELDEHRLTENLRTEMARQQEVILVATPGGRFGWDNSERTAAIKSWKHPTDVDKGSWVSVTRGCTVLFAGIGVNDVNNQIDDYVDVPNFLSTFHEYLWDVYEDLHGENNDHDNRIVVLGMPDYSGAASQLRRDTVQRLGWLYRGFARMIQAPFYDPWDLIQSNPSYIDTDNLHYTQFGADQVMAALVDAWEGNVNTEPCYQPNDPDVIAEKVKEALFDTESQANKIKVGATGGVKLGDAGDIDTDFDLAAVETDARDAAAAVRNRVNINRATGRVTVYDNDGTTIKYQRDVSGNLQGDESDEIPV